jgi:hypothetical protein
VPRLHWRLGSGSTARKGTDGAAGLVSAAEEAVRRRVAALLRIRRLGTSRPPRRGTVWTRPRGRLARKALVVAGLGFVCLAGHENQRVGLLSPPAAESGSGPNSHAITSGGPSPWDVWIRPTPDLRVDVPDPQIGPHPLFDLIGPAGSIRVDATGVPGGAAAPALPETVPGALAAVALMVAFVRRSRVAPGRSPDLDDGSETADVSRERALQADRSSDAVPDRGPARDAGADVQHRTRAPQRPTCGTGPTPGRQLAEPEVDRSTVSSSEATPPTRDRAPVPSHRGADPVARPVPGAASPSRVVLYQATSWTS